MPFEDTRTHEEREESFGPGGLDEILQLKGRIEAVLYMTGKSLSLKEIADMISAH
jgi:hypothetical protein